MAIGVLLITHDGVGASLLDTAVHVYGRAPLAADQLAVARDADPDVAFEHAMAMCEHLDSGAGVLVLSDLFGSTPGNVARRVAQHARARAVAGVNVPMLVRVFNYPDLDLDAMVRKAVEAGRDGVVVSEPT